MQKGDVFGELTALNKTRQANRNCYWLFKCSCGKEKEIRTDHVVKYKTHCGCQGKKARKDIIKIPIQLLVNMLLLLIKKNGKRGRPKGFVVSKETKKKLSERKIGEKSSLWKGESAGYHAKHSWIRKKYGKASKCEVCGIINDSSRLIIIRYTWANLDHKYVRDIQFWKQMCPSCHYKHDKENIRVLNTRKGCKARYINQT